MVLEDAKLPELPHYKKLQRMDQENEYLGALLLTVG
jgi:hypothetical protein